MSVSTSSVRPEIESGEPLLASAEKNTPRPDPVIFALFVFVGISAWLTVNATWSELPLFAQTLPEGWAISTYLSLALQVANVGPLAYAFARSRRHVSVSGTIAALLLLAVVAGGLLAAFWDRTAMVGGSRHSVALLLLTFLSGVVDCTTTLVYWPFAAAWPRPYTVAMAVGESASGTVMGLIAIAQDPGHANRFSVSIFFIIVVGITLVSAYSFALLASPARVVLQRLSTQRAPLPGPASPPPPPPPQPQANDGAESDPGAGRRRPFVAPFRTSTAIRALPREMASLAAVAAAQNGILVSVTTYVFLPFPGGSDLLLWSGVLGSAVDPLVSLLAHWSGPRPLGRLVSVWAPCVALLLAVAAGSPRPPLHDSPVFGITLVVVFLLARAGLSFTKISALLQIREAVPPDCGQDTSRWAEDATHAAGVVIQGSSFVASVVMFLLVTVGHVFRQP